MRMKKVLTLLLALVLILVLAAAGIFFWKGGHHALYLADAAMEWLESDESDQTVRIEVNGISLSAQTFWMELDDELVYGLEAEGYAVYLRENVLYMDSGAAYTLPPMVPDMDQVYRLLAGAVLYGRIEKKDGVYHFTMEAEELTLSADLTAGEELQNLSLSGAFLWNGEPVQLTASMAQTPEQVHTLPEAVADAMVRAEIEPPLPLTEPLNVLLPALEQLLPLEADVELGVECGILSLSETADLTIENGKAALIREGIILELALPAELSELSPAAGALLFLRSGEFSREGSAAAFRVSLPAEATAELVGQLVPQAAELGITFKSSKAVLHIMDKRLTRVTLTAEGSVPFLFTTIPVSFAATFDIH